MQWCNAMVSSSHDGNGALVRWYNAMVKYFPLHMLAMMPWWNGAMQGCEGRMVSSSHDGNGGSSPMNQSETMGDRVNWRHWRKLYCIAIVFHCIGVHWNALYFTELHCIASWVNCRHCWIAMFYCVALYFAVHRTFTELHCIAYWVNWRHCWKLYWIAMQLYFTELNIYCSALHVGWSGELALLKAPLRTLALVMHCSALIQYNTFLWCIEALNTLPGAV